MRYPAAEWRPTSKHGYGNDDAHLNKGVVVHSMEGSITAAFGELDNPNRQASWTFSLAKSGQVYQHVDTANIAWTNGSYNANKRFWGIECEGKAGEPVTGAQLDALVALLAWLFDTHGLTSFVRRETLWEHNEMTAYGAAATACPSGRIPWPAIIAALNEEEIDMQQLQELAQRVTFLEHDKLGHVEFIRFDGQPEVYRVGGNTLEHVESQLALNAQADEADVTTVKVVKKGTAEWTAYKAMAAFYRTIPARMTG